MYLLFFAFLILFTSTSIQYSMACLSPYAWARFYMTSEVSLIKILYGETPFLAKFLLSSTNLLKRTVSLYFNKSRRVSSWVISLSLEMTLNGHCLSSGNLCPFLRIFVIMSLQILTIRTRLSPSAVNEECAIAMKSPNLLLER
jgi:hypothetical protein